MSFDGFPSSPSALNVGNDGFWPDIAVADFQDRYRLPREYAELLLVDALQIGMAWANPRLADWKASRLAEGYAAVDDAPSEQLGGVSINRIHYLRAVMSHAKAYLLRQFPTINRRSGSEHDGREAPESAAVFEQFAVSAVSDLLGLGGINVELL